MKPFTKTETIMLGAIFIVLLVISVPNFIASLRRARDQVRRDDLGAMQQALDSYQADFGIYPLSSPDGRLLACKNPGDKVTVDVKGRLLVNLIPCNWGKDAFVDLTPGSSKVYLKAVPGDPELTHGIHYVYYSDGHRYQIFASFEGKDEAEYDSKIVIRNISCGERNCNVGRAFNCNLYKTIEEYDRELENKRN